MNCASKVKEPQYLAADSDSGALKRFCQTVFAVSALVVGAVALANALISARVPKMGPRLGGYFGRYPARFGDLAYVVAGTGEPVLLVHGLDAGRSMAEWRAVFDELAENHTVYAFDFQGFGLSDPTPGGYCATGFAEQIANFIRDIIGRETAVIAAGQSALLAVLAAHDEALISHLILVCPQTGALEVASGESRAETLAQRELFQGVLRLPVLGTAALNWQNSLKNLERFALTRALFDKSQAGKESRLWHVTAHQSGAQHAQKALLLGHFALDWRQLWNQTQVPAALIWGRNAKGEGYEASSEWLALRPDAELHVVENAMLFPHLEHPREFCEFVNHWLREQSLKLNPVRS